ncbi:hypothetical protein CR513_10415, partial [Mucuna pruriens]
MACLEDKKDSRGSYGNSIILSFRNKKLFCYHKVRCDWFHFGNKNTNFFHLSTIVRRKRNCIEVLHNHKGKLIIEPDQIKGFNLQYDPQLFSSISPDQGESMPSLASPNQCSFVLGRQSFTNIVISHEIFHSIGTKRGKQGYIAIKVDLEKAYDNIW